MSEDMLGQVVRKLAQLPTAMLGMLFDLLNKITGPKGTMWLRRLKRFLRGENPFGVPKTFEVTTDGRIGEQLVADIEAQGDHVGDIAKQLIHGKKFVATNGITYKLALIMGDEFKDDDRITSNIRAEAAKHGYVDPPMELALYVREMFSDEDLEQIGLWALIIMHEAVADSDGNLSLLGLDRDVGGRSLSAFNVSPDDEWDRGFGFLFLVPASN
ncbi:MAG: hypothetical protein A3H67_03970 [Candidatus Buchananbacteria bacterium RIFCSPLOWO2_02_FULL_46_11b]|uniref:Uncharacterized protein n=1 Tax=Candidatus Buchananbacteria bacterium RIFCSPLOWO2_02_FULL_46_11b TaxID=1797548 RepID=A0A1G1Z0T8_9BACT|nr:MAG: hypothetical protein A3H67_03970 [Candidatus Buchananbacteria bacterium RIFCSPLOWO2_02_FULL_46_11b]